MAMIRAVVRATLEPVGEDEVDIRMSTGDIARDGHILVPQGAQLDNYRANPVVLWQHDPDYPVGRASQVAVAGNAITARVTFAPAGISPKADEVRGLVKSGIVNAVSVGFDPLDGEPLDPKKPWGGQRFFSWELLECSFVSVPADTGAIVTAREHNRADSAKWTVGAARNLPIDDSDSWDGGAAAASIFEYAGGDDFSPAKAKRGFLVYDAANPSLRGSYKLPIAQAKDGKLVVPAGAIRAAASRLPQTDIPDDVKKRAQAVLDAYRKKAGIGEDNQKEEKRAMRRGMYGVAQLACALENLGYIQECAELEAACEGDDSAVPGLVMNAIKAGCTALLAMTAEECAELIAGDDEDEGAEEMGPGERFRRALARQRQVVDLDPSEWRALQTRAGKTLSAATQSTLNAALDDHEEAMRGYRAAMAVHRRGMARIRDMMDGDSGSGDVGGSSDGGEGDAAARADADFRQRRLALRDRRDRAA